MGWSGWKELGGTTDVSLAPVTFANKLYLFAKGIADKGVYVSSTADGLNWSGWAALGGTTDVALGPVVFRSKLYLFAKGIADQRIYVSSTADGLNWSSWAAALGGTTNVALAPVVFGGNLYLFAKGIADKGIYVSSTAMGTPWTTVGPLLWTPWRQLGGTTDVSLAPVAQGNRLFLFSKGIADKRIYVSSSTDGANWTPWSEFGGTTDAAARAVSYGRDLYVFGKGLADKRIYVTSGLDGSAWSIWYEVPPRGWTTDVSVAAVVFSNRIYLFAKLLDGHIVMQSIAIYRLPFDDDGGWDVGSNWDGPGGGHGVGQPFGTGQEYAFDFGHPIGGNVRTARAGKVVAVENNAGNTVDTTAPNYDPSAPGYGTAILIRHGDGTVAAYDHLQFESTRVVMNQTVQRGEIIALSGHTGRSFDPHLHFDVRQYWHSKTDLGPTIPIYFEDKHHASWRPQAGDVVASNNA